MRSIHSVLALALLPLGCRATASEVAPASEPARVRPLEVLLLGDWTSIGYTPFVRELLAGEASVARPRLEDGRPENCAGTNMGVSGVERWVAPDEGAWDVIHFDFGLHDRERVAPETGRNSDDPDDTHQAAPGRYVEQLGRIVDVLAATGAELVFATMTPVLPGGVRPHRDPPDVVLYNQLALGVVEPRGIAVNDLYAVADARQDELQQPVDVHFTEAGSRALTEAVAQAVREAASSTP